MGGVRDASRMPPGLASQRLHSLDSKSSKMPKTLSVVIPSRARERQIFFLEQAVASVRRQTAFNDFLVDFFVAVDQGMALDKRVCERLKVFCIESPGHSQARALNAAIRKIDSEYVAFLEDDDQWKPDFLSVAFSAMEEAQVDFISSTQSEYDELGNYLRINDFPTPSGWFMKTSILRKIGEFNEAYQFHLDNECLGRLHDTGTKRAHLVEATAPSEFHYAQFVRPWLANLVGESKNFAYCDGMHRRFRWSTGSFIPSPTWCRLLPTQTRRSVPMMSTECF